ncbi:Smr/MutS family protein [Perlucidibaca aquatica]|uniref:Smr/MutS family protein n=1 Tax=Perlucidibaca aquatica TaxID=1852776 RepID=UPI00083B3702|nr:Smr/MutS family protein [Perlucidibaca aquatica]
MKDPQLTALKRQLKAEAPLPAPKLVKSVPAREPEPELDDQALFEQATRGARKLSVDSAVPARPQRPKKPDALTLLKRARAEGDAERENIALSDTVALLQGVSPEAALSFKRNGVQERQLDKLKTGLLPWKHAVDLHGCTLEQAREAVLQLLAEAKAESITVVKIVHGKGQINGQAMLKTAVNGWLRQMPDVLAFVSADPRHGGTGAVMVLLRRPREDKMPALSSLP